MGQQLPFKRKHRGVVPIHGPWHVYRKTLRLNLKREVSQTEKRFKIAIICFWVVDNILEKKVLNGLCEGRCHQATVRLRVFMGFFDP